MSGYKENNNENESFAGQTVRLTKEAAYRLGAGSTVMHGSAFYNSRTKFYEFRSGTCSYDRLDVTDLEVVPPNEVQAAFVLAGQSNATRDAIMKEVSKPLGVFDPSNQLNPTLNHNKM